MADHSIQDTFEPYYAGRDGFARKPARKPTEKPENTPAKAVPHRKQADNESRDDDRAREH